MFLKIYRQKTMQMLLIFVFAHFFYIILLINVDAFSKSDINEFERSVFDTYVDIF